MQRLQHAVCEGAKGGIAAFVVAFVVGALIAVGAAYSGHTAAPTHVGQSVVSIGTIMGGSFGALYLIVMFVGGLVETKRTTVR